MTFLLGDVGGTNTRLALGNTGGVDKDSVRRFRNDDFGSFCEVLESYLETQGRPDLSRVCVAVAGPLGTSSTRLTNRDWNFDQTQISEATRTGAPVLINDLSALGLALPYLTPKHLSGPATPSGVGQKLVVGMGTGFNVSLAKIDDTGQANVFEAELGHASLPVTVMQHLSQTIPKAPARFRKVEEVFCGPGLSELHRSLTGRDVGADEIMRQYVDSQDPKAETSVVLFAEALGVLARELVHLYMPRAGLVFAGSVSAALLSSDAFTPFFSAFNSDDLTGLDPKQLGLSLITEDTAALTGCLERLLRG